MNKLRECIVNGKQSLFHCWENKSNIIAPSMIQCGHGGGCVSGTFGIVEYKEDGTVHECYPDDITFCIEKKEEEQE